MTDFTHHTPRLLSDADAAADLAGVARPSLPSVGTEDAREIADGLWRIYQDTAADMLRSLAAERDELASRVSELEAEVLDQCRLNGMGAERESALMGRVRELESAALAAQPGAATIPAGYRVEVVSDFDVRVYGPNKETWLIREEGEGTFSNFVYRMLLAAAPTEAKPAQDAVDATLAHLDDLKDDAAAHIWPDDLERCQTSECVVQVASVRMGSPDGMTVPLFSREQVADAIRAAISAKKGGAA